MQLQFSEDYFIFHAFIPSRRPPTTHARQEATVRSRSRARDITARDERLVGSSGRRRPAARRRAARRASHTRARPVMGCACSSSRDDSRDAGKRDTDVSSRRAPATHAERRRSLDVFHDAYASFRDSFRAFRSPTHAHWTETACAWLDVRAKTYLNDGVKARPRRKALFALRHVDLFDGSALDGDATRDACGRFSESWFQRECVRARKEERDMPWTFAFQFVNPDGAGLVCYFQLNDDRDEDEDEDEEKSPATTREEVVARVERACENEDDEAFARILRRFFIDGDDEYRSERIKVCAKFLKAPMLLRKIIPSRPVLVGKRARTLFYHGAGTPFEGKYFECDLVCASNASAKYLYASFSSLSAKSEEDVAIWIESREKDELPERLLGAVRFRNIGPKCLTKLVVGSGIV